MKLAVSIVNYNTQDLTKKCLVNLLSQEGVQIDEIWVLDNNSTDDSVEMLRRESKRDGRIHLIENEVNVGFAKAHNQIFKKTEADLILVLNPDTSFLDSTLSKMVRFMNLNLACGIASCKITDYSGKLQSNGGDLPFGLALIAWLFNLEMLGIKSNYHQTRADYYIGVKKVGWVGGTLMLLRREVINQIGGFNEAYFMYFEDVELCYMAKQKGFEVMLNNNVEIKHISGASSDDPHLNQWRGEFKGVIYFYNKYFGGFKAMVVRVLVYISIMLRMVAFLVSGNVKFYKTYEQILLTI